jgi:hypothetical protein
VSRGDKSRASKEEICVSEQLFGLEISDEAYTGMVPGGKREILCAAYLAAIGLAMTGWLWLIGWCVLQLV